MKLGKLVDDLLFGFGNKFRHKSQVSETKTDVKRLKYSERSVLETLLVLHLL